MLRWCLNATLVLIRLKISSRCVYWFGCIYSRHYSLFSFECAMCSHVERDRMVQSSNDTKETKDKDKLGSMPGEMCCFIQIWKAIGKAVAMLWANAKWFEWWHHMFRTVWSNVLCPHNANGGEKKVIVEDMHINSEDGHQQTENGKCIHREWSGNLTMTHPPKKEANERKLKGNTRQNGFELMTIEWEFGLEKTRERNK